MKKILVIDDDDVTREFVAHVLEGAGYKVSTASEGAEGLALAEKVRPGLIISDIQMDGWDGYTTLSLLREHAATATTPVILISAAADTHGFRQGMALGADDYLLKPFSASALLAAVKAQERKQAVWLKKAEDSMNALRSSLTLALPHELNTPLNGIMGIARLLKSDAASLSPEDVEMFADDLLISSERLYRVVFNYLTYVQIELNSRDPVAIAALRRSRMDNVVPVIQASARRIADEKDRGEDLRLELAGAMPAAVQESNLDKIVSELVQNAFTFSPAGSPVVVRGTFESSFFVLRIMDKGRGMTEDQICRIGAYSQFDREVHAHEGLGLGLAIASHMSELYGGGLEVESMPGEGTTVTVRIPVP
jgi:two-component system, sensor histidine kinase and response regulator